MTSLGDITLRTEALCRKYEKYAAPNNDKQKDLEKGRKRGTDVFAEMYEEVFADVQALNEKADEISREKNRAAVAEQNAQLRRAKAAILQTDIPKLQKIVKRGKKITREMIAEREELIEKLVKATNEIPDGVHGVRKPMRPTKSRSAASGSGSKMVVNVAMDENSTMFSNPSYNEHTEESQAFRNEWNDARTRQDAVLDEISNGLSQLKDMGMAMQEELDLQDPLVDAIEDKVDSVNTNISSNNKKMAATVYKLRSSRRICVDIVLILVLMLVVYWIWQVLVSSGVI
mmetsp:Transcript_35692/g.101030  ORF Transcript_35692/g.101030 Transcript_35692/m.101030 type:complete len:287 (+) Transcript_35692:103-963(+)